jgi:hypothetical protein
VFEYLINAQFKMFELETNVTIYKYISSDNIDDSLEELLTSIVQVPCLLSLNIC